MSSDPLALHQELAETLQRARERALRILELEAEVKRYQDRLRALQGALKVLSAEEAAAI